MDRSKFLPYLFDFADILVTVLNSATKTIQAQIGDATGQTPDSDDAEWWQHTGFASRPATPTQGNSACQGVVFKHGDRDVIVATRDVRGTSIYGNLKDGETCVYASSGQARTLYKANGAVVQYTTSDNTSGGTGVSAYVGPDKIQFVNQWGAITIDASGITLTAGQAGLTLTNAGVATLSGTKVSVSGSIAAIAGQVATCVGANAVPSGVPGVTPGPTSALLGLTGVAAAPSHNVFIGP